MIVATQTAEPTELRAGETWTWTRELPEYPPSDGWSLRYAVTDLSGAPVLQVTAAVEGSSYAVRVEASQTALVKPGRYTLAGRVERTDPAEVRYVYVGELTVLPDPFGGTDVRTHAERMLALIDAALEGRIPADAERITINGRSLDRIPIRELRRLRGIYAAQVRAERHGGPVIGSVEVCFVPVD